MAPKARIVLECPNSENTIAVEEYRASSPEKFSLQNDDKFILYGGGHNYTAKFKHHPHQQLVVDKPLVNVDYEHVSLYILNTSVILWFDRDDLGLELPYQLISLHGVKAATELEPDKLYLQILQNELILSAPQVPTDFTITSELEIMVGQGGSVATNLFCRSDTIEQLYQALCKCSSLHYDSENSDDDSSGGFGATLTQQEALALDIPSDWLGYDHDIVLPNTGSADDLEFDDTPAHDHNDAAMPVDVGYASIAGSVRKRDSDTNIASKNRRIH